MCQRFGHSDADRPLKRCVTVEAMGGGLPKPRPVIGRKHSGVRRMGLQQDAPFGIADEIRKELVVFPDRGEPLRYPLIFPSDNVGHGQRQDPLSGLAQGTVEDFVHLAPDNHAGDARSEQPKYRQHKADRQGQPRHEARGPPHGLPRR